MEILILLLLIFLVVGLDTRIKKVNYQLNSSKIRNDEKIIVISDFHSGKPDKIIELVKEEKPTLIFLTGDIFEYQVPLEPCIKLFTEISKVAPCYFITGNHEFGKKSISYEHLNQILLQNNIINCDDSKIMIHENIQVYGFKDYFSYKTSVEMSLVLQKRKIDEICKDTDSNMFNIVLIHRPHLFKKFDEYPIDLMISGHCHGGQWRIPYLINGLYAPQQGFFPKRAGGEYPLTHGKHIVSRGLVNHWFLPRIYNRPELVIIEIKKDHK